MLNFYIWVLRKLIASDDFLHPSDEEVLRYSSEASAYSEESGAQSDEEGNYDGSESRRRNINGSAGDNALSQQMEESDEEEEEEEGWGPHRQDYYDADKIETEQDALDEEAEALRIQRRHLQGLGEADFGFDELGWDENDADDIEGEETERIVGVSTEILPQKQITEDMTPAERLDILNRRYPEFDPLSQEFIFLQDLHEKMTSEIPRLKRVTQPHLSGSIGPIVIKYQALTAYLASLTMYFAILSTPKGMEEGSTAIISPANLRAHSIMDNLYRCRSLWEKVKNYPIADITDESEHDSEQELTATTSDITEARRASEFPKNTNTEKRKKKIEHGKKRKEALLKADTAAQLEEKSRQLEQELQVLDSLAALAKQPNRLEPKSKLKVPHDGDFSASDLGEETEMTAYEVAEKAKKRKRLRFYTSQIAQRANRRDMAGKGASGDMDIPYRERLRDRSARLTAEAASRARSKTKDRADLGGDDDDDDDNLGTGPNSKNQIREDDDNDNDYYNEIVKHNQERKNERKRSAGMVTGSSEHGRSTAMEEVDPDGKRAVTYAIEKNKGLTPRRKKEVRNPRVKKRKRFEDKKKKLGSMKPIYKGGEGKGGYRGELTGIKTDVVKSIKLQKN